MTGVYGVTLDDDDIVGRGIRLIVAQRDGLTENEGGKAPRYRKWESGVGKARSMDNWGCQGQNGRPLNKWSSMPQRMVINEAMCMLNGWVAHCRALSTTKARRMGGRRVANSICRVAGVK